MRVAACRSALSRSASVRPGKRRANSSLCVGVRTNVLVASKNSRTLRIISCWRSEPDAPLIAAPLAGRGRDWGPASAGMAGGGGDGGPAWGGMVGDGRNFAAAGAILEDPPSAAELDVSLTGVAR